MTPKVSLVYVVKQHWKALAIILPYDRIPVCRGHCGCFQSRCAGRFRAHIWKQLVHRRHRW